MSLIAILTDPGKGGTFLTWSLHYLAGHTHYFNAELNSWLDLPENPLTNRNAHNFKANQIGTYSHVISTLTNLSNCKAFDFHTVYLHNLQEIPYSKESVDTKKPLVTLCYIQINLLLLPINQKIHCMTSVFLCERHLNQ